MTKVKQFFNTVQAWFQKKPSDTCVSFFDTIERTQANLKGGIATLVETVEQKKNRAFYKTPKALTL
uniref:Uncharacterized protein n=1 Tax=Cyanophora sudae TaxID=1522369 RepID=A0A873WV77_9EUKA|nr:hypothetical protein DXZ12_mgp40 [Cyanophora sudae]QPB15084.1 hypothetical protein [Cyanophora sudae]